MLIDDSVENMLLLKTLTRCKCLSGSDDNTVTLRPVNAQLVGNNDV